MMEKYKYPFVPKEYYPAVMFACKMIRENGHFNKAVKIAANYYNVDETTLEKHIRNRQGAGQKGRSNQYSWFLVYGYKDYMANDDCGTCNSWDYTEDDYIKNFISVIVKATSEKNAKNQIHKKYSDDYGKFIRTVHIVQFNTEKEAKEEQEKGLEKEVFLGWCMNERYGGITQLIAQLNN